MNYKIYIYVISMFISAYALTGVNFDAFIKKGKIVETKILLMVLGMSLSYLVSNFIINFIELSKII